MKVAIITINDNNNYGNRLQNYALQQFLKSEFCNVDSIWYSEKENSILNKKIWTWKSIIKYIINKGNFRDYVNKYYLRDVLRIYNISKFTQKYINTKYDFIIKKDLDNEYDYFIVGSDQVWNTQLNFNDLNYFLKFVKDDKKKNNETDDNNAYGDLIIWKQIIKFAKGNNVGIVFVTHDQKEDWWNIVKGKTIGPRIELRREFLEETKQFFHMYSMNSFISEYNRIYDTPIEKSAVEEVFSLDDTDRRFKTRKALSSSEKIARTVETLDKISKRIERRRKIIEDIERKYQNQGLELPANIKTQYDNTLSKMQELEKEYEKRQQQLELLQNNNQDN